MAATKKPTAVENGEEKPFLSEEKIRILKEGILKDYNEADVIMFLTVAELTKLDPFTRQLMPRPEKKVKDRSGKWEKMILMTAYTGFLTVADRSGVYDGSDPFEWCGKNGEWTQVWTAEEPPFAARVATWRKDHTRPEVAVSYWKARAQYFYSDGKRILTDQWRDDGPFMLGKCALAASLRKLFPNLLTQVYEESEFKALEASTFEQDVKDHEQQIAESAAAAERLKAQGVPTVQPSAPTFPRDAKTEVEPAKGLEPKDYQPGDEPDDLDMTDANYDKNRPKDWYKYLNCDPIKNKYYTGKTVAELSTSLLQQAVEKWVPLVRAKPNAAKVAVELADALELAWEEAQEVAAKAEAQKAANASEGSQ